MPLFEATIALETSDAFHMSRLLLLIDAFSVQDQTCSVQGITKLAKLDFLLRYPANLEHALIAQGVKTESAAVKDYERHTVESSMIRFRYGPWDFRYRRFLNLLVARGLIHLHVSGRTVHVSSMAEGHRIATGLYSLLFTDIYSLKENSLSETQLIIADTDIATPPAGSSFKARLMIAGDKENPPLIPYYSGH